MAFAFRFENRVVLASLHGILLPILGVEVGSIRGQRILLDPIDVVVEQIQILLALIDNFDADRFAKRHVPETVVRVGVFHDHWNADHLRAFAKAVGKEVAKGDLNRGTLLAVVEHPYQKLLVVGRALRRPRLALRPQKREPHVCDHTGALRVEHDFGRACTEPRVVAVPVHIVAILVHSGRCGPHAATLFRFGKFFQRLAQDQRRHSVQHNQSQGQPDNRTQRQNRHDQSPQGGTQQGRGRQVYILV